MLEKCNISLCFCAVEKEEYFDDEYVVCFHCVRFVGIFISHTCPAHKKDHHAKKVKKKEKALF